MSSVNLKSDVKLNSLALQNYLSATGGFINISMSYVPYRHDWFYTEIDVPNLTQIQDDFTQFFWKVLGNNLPDATGFYIVDQNTIDYPTSLNALKDYYNLSDRWCSVNFSVINNGAEFGGIHYDFVMGAEKYIALNIPLINCQGSYNVWYSGEPGDKTQISTYNNNTKVIVYANEDNAQAVDTTDTYWVTGHVEELERVECVKPMLVHIGRPHQPEVTHNNLRVLLSLRFRPELTDSEFDRIVNKSSVL
jgi:hypothetical protein